MPVDKIYADSETGCCKRFDPKPWQDREVRLKDKLFLKDSVKSFLHIPLNFGQVMKKNAEKIAAAGALPQMPLMLSDEKSLLGSDVYIAVSKDVPDSNMVKISGSFLTKVFEGSYKDMGRWIKEMQAYVASKGKKAEKLYFFYTTCPSCAKFYGKNYTVILAKI
ncbi:MAG: hydrolase [Candidatus Woesearchaeota archaeon]